MWIEKLAVGVVQVQTPIGPRYLIPSFPQRVYLLWIFRNFHTLPAGVLSRGQQRRIERMCMKYGFVSQFGPNPGEEFAVLGTLEQRPLAMESLPLKRPAASVRPGVSPVVADAQQQS